MTKAIVVVVRFASGSYVDIDLTESNPKKALGAFAGRLLANGAEPPLLDAFHSEISLDELRQLLDKAPRKQLAPPPLPVSVKGLLIACGAYVKNTGTQHPDIPHARDTLEAFFSRFGLNLDFAGEPE